MQETNHDVDVESVLSDVKASGAFGRSRRQFSLLEYLLKASQAGTAADITQYAIAVDVLERPETFDASADSVVRVQMHRLRANIQKYNAADRQFHLTIKPASYHAQVISRKTKPESQGFSGPMILSAGFLLCTVFIAGIYALFSGPFNRGAEARTAACSQIIPNIRVRHVGEDASAKVYTDKIIRAALSNHTGLSLLATPDQKCSANSAPVLDVNYAVSDSGDGTRSNIILTVTDAKDNIIGSFHISDAPAESASGSKVYNEIVTAINEVAVADGMIARHAAQLRWSVPENRAGFTCVLMMYDSFAGETETSLPDVNACLENSLKSENPPGDNYGALASGYLDLARSSEGEARKRFFEQAESLLNSAPVNRVDSVELTIAGLYYEAQRSDFNAERLDRLLNEAQSRFNLNPHVLMNVAYFRGYSLGDWEASKTTSDKVKSLYKTRDQSMFVVDAGYALVNGAAETDMRVCAKLYAENSRAINIIVNACARKFGNKDWYLRTEANLTEMGLNTVEARLAVIEHLNRNRDFLSFIGAALKLQPGGAID